MSRCHNGMWHDATLKNIWYVPDASAHLFSVKASTQHSYSTTLNEKEVVIRRGDGTAAALGKLVNNIYILAIRVGIPWHTAEVHLATQVETLQQKKACNLAHERTSLSNDTIDSVLRHREVGQAKDLSALPCK